MEFERAAALLEGAERAPGLGLAAAPEEDDLAEPARRTAVPQSRLRAARSWLFALGYLAEDTDVPDYDPALHVAVAAFQREAGLTVDGWVGARQTWPRLRELVAFEEALEPAFWAADGDVPKPALIRAVATRLRLYGIAAPVEGGPALNTAVRAFFAATAALGGPAESLGLSETIWLAGVLDHDRHVAGIVAGWDGAGPQAILARPADDPDAVGAMGVLMNMAKIELWLAQGAETRLGTAFGARRRFGDGPWVLPAPLGGDMDAYFDALDPDVPGTARLRRGYRTAIRAEDTGAALLRFLDAAHRFGTLEDPFTAGRLAQLDAFYGGRGNGVPRRAAVTVEALTGRESLRARLWDGIRRIGSWLGRALERALATGARVLKLARDIAAFAFRAASEGLAFLRRGITAFLGHVAVAVRRQNPDAEGRVLVARSLGRDVDVVVGPDRAAARRHLSRLVLSAGIFRRACGLLGCAIGIGLSVAGVAIAPPLVLRTAIAAVRDLPGAIRTVREIADLQRRYERLAEPA